MSEDQSSPILDFYSGKNVFITGGTGFVGICLIEKILRDIPNIGTLYVLMRPKRKCTIEERFEAMTKNPIFEKLLENHKDEIFKKIQPIQGDVGEENLGLTTEGRQLLIDNVQIVIHSAATLDFFQTLKETTNINLSGTRRVMNLCKEIKNLQAMVHVSSAYVNSYLLEAEEILYEAPDNPDRIIDLCNTLNDISLTELEPRLLKGHPNTYTFTKHLAEHEVNKCSSLFPCGIVRPSMITAAWKEPVVGWTISKNGPQGFFMGASKGVIRRLPLDPSLVMDYIPVDVVVNQILVTGCHIANLKAQNIEKPLELTIFHLTSSTYKPFRFETLTNKMNDYMHKYPLQSSVWYPHIKLVKSLFLFKLSAIFFHFAPGLILDLVTKLGGGRPILTKLHTNVWKSLKTLERFIFTEWKFHNKKTLMLARSMTQADKKKFFIDIAELNWEEYFFTLHLGVRQYLNKENISNIDAARKKDKILLALHVILQLVFYYMIWCLFGSIFGISESKSAVAVGVFYIFFSRL